MTWLIYFEDSEMQDEIFTDETAVRARFDALLDNWTCHLFVLDSSSKTKRKHRQSSGGKSLVGLTIPDRGFLGC